MSSTAAHHTTDRPALCVDLDGTLIQSDLLFESFLLLIRQAPLALLLIPFWLLRGKAVLKAEIAARVVLCARTLPYNVALIRWLEAERNSGRRLWLCTAANTALAARVAAHLQLFDGVLASDRRVNLSGSVKGARLVQYFGERGFDYCGNERCDIAVWKRANGAIVVNGHKALPQAVAPHAPVLRIFPPRQLGGLSSVIRTMRLRVWLENCLVFVPILLLRRFDSADVLALLLTFLALSLCASAIHIAGDLMRIDSARLHAEESRNCFSTGELSIFGGLWLVLGLFGGALASLWLLPRNLWLVLLAYASLTTLRDLAERTRGAGGLLAAGGLHMIRLLAGAVAIGLSF